MENMNKDYDEELEKFLVQAQKLSTSLVGAGTFNRYNNPIDKINELQDYCWEAAATINTLLIEIKRLQR